MDEYGALVAAMPLHDDDGDGYNKVLIGYNHKRRSWYVFVPERC